MVGDHLGGLPSILKELPGNVQVLAHEEEKPYIQGEKQPTKLAQLEARLYSLPDEMKMLYQKLKAGYKNCMVNVDKTLIELPYCGGIQVIFTPGHTPGHICLYLKQSKILIAGDILFVEDGMLVKPPEFTNFDLDLSSRSLKKLTEYDIETVVCYHGGLYQDNTNQRIADLVNG
ncbi:MAG: MBL fold metallo-hydrolase [Bacillota bacterium]